MASFPVRAARLARVSKLVESELAALPDRVPTPPPEQELVAISDDDISGGVSLSEPSSQPPIFAPAPAPAPAPAKSSDEVAPITSFDKDPTPAPASQVNTERRAVLVEGAASLHNPSSTPKLATQPADKLPLPSLQKSELAAEKSFAPLLALQKYPYKYCDKRYMQKIASASFDANKFWEREWDLYYVWDLEESKPLILVSESQFTDLLHEVNSLCDLNLRVTDQQREEGLVGHFPDHPRCQPRYLGRSTSKEEYEALIVNVPGAMSRIANESAPPAIDNLKLQAFRDMWDEMQDATKAKTKATREKKKAERLAKQKASANEFKRAQRYLGLRPAALKGQPGPTLALQAIDDSLTAPFPFDMSVVFVCIDVESYERAHHKITEIGIATLDTRDLAGVAPGKDGKTWRSRIHARHFRIQEYAHLVNSDFVHGCPDRFDFGTSEWVKLNDAPALVATCFKAPFCGAVDAISDLESRNLIFLGHNTLGDIKYLQDLGFDPLTLPNLKETQDTATLYRVWRREQQTTKLGSILYDFDIPGFNLHNAGNDAVFTVQAMLGICVREASIRGSSELKALRDEEKAAKAQTALLEAKQRAEDDADGWSELEADGDGGAPVPIAIRSRAVGGGRVERGGYAEGYAGRGRGEHTDANGGYRSRNAHADSHEAGRYRLVSRPQINGRPSQPTRGDGRGRGRARSGGRNRGSGSTTFPPSDDGFPGSGPQVKYHW